MIADLGQAKRDGDGSVVGRRAGEGEWLFCGIAGSSTGKLDVWRTSNGGFVSERAGRGEAVGPGGDEGVVHSGEGRRFGMLKVGSRWLGRRE